jgi:HNH endonuclease
MVLDEDYEWATQWSWYVRKDPQNPRATPYAMRSVYVGHRRVSVLLHRELAMRAGVEITGLEVDHHDGNGLNNARWNLRAATHRQNMQNSQRGSANKSGVKGVFFSCSRGKWRCSFARADGVRRLIDFATRTEAVAARLEAETQIQGAYARRASDELTGVDIAAFTLADGRELRSF